MCWLRRVTPKGSKGMVMTSDAIRRELYRIEALIEALRNSFPIAGDDIEDLCWLQEQRRHLGALLAARQAQRGKRLVSLAVWRDGGTSRRPATAA